MALFGLKKNTEKKTDKTTLKSMGNKKPSKKVEKVVAERVASSTYLNSNIIVRPRITEKAGIMAENNVYTFEVLKSANKFSVAKAIKGIYKVNPIKVRIINLKERRVFVRGKSGKQSGVKKALVYLKKGDKIEIA